MMTKWIFAALFSVPLLAQALTIQTTESQLFNHSSRTIKSFTLTANCLWRPDGMHTADNCGSTRPKLVWGANGRFTIPTFKFVEKHPPGGIVEYEIVATVQLDDGVKYETTIYEERSHPLKNQLRSFTFWGLDPVNLELLLRDGSPSEAFIRSLQSPRLVVEMTVMRRERDQAAWVATSEETKTGKLVFPTNDPTWWPGYRLMAAPEVSDLTANVEIRVYQDYSHVYFQLKTVAPFSPDMIKRLVGDKIRMNAP